MPGPFHCGSHRCERPFSRSYGANLQSSLAADHSSASVCSTQPPVSVCGTGSTLAFLGSLPCSRFPRRVGSAGYSVCPPACCRSVTSIAWRSGNIQPVAIGVPVRVSLRARLTLIRLTLIRNPESFGDKVSHLVYRYLCLHLLFRPLHRGSPLRIQRRTECSPTDYC